MQSNMPNKSTNLVIIQGDIEEDEEWEYYDEPISTTLNDKYVKVSLWIKEKDKVFGATEQVTSASLEPGMYFTGYDRDVGYYCQKIAFKTDELFLFSDSIIEDLFNEIDLFWSKKEMYKANNLIHKRGILLEGFPGTGKSTVITQLCEKLISKGGVVFKVNNFRNLDDYIKFMQNQFRKIQPNTPIITILEDIDQYSEVEVELLDFLDGKFSLDHHVVIATTNNTENIPDTFLRPSRLDIKIEIPPASETTRREYFKFKNVPITELETLVKLTDNFTLADLKEVYICIYLLDYSIEEAVEKITTPRTKKNYLTSDSQGSQLGF